MLLDPTQRFLALEIDGNDTVVYDINRQRPVKLSREYRTKRQTGLICAFGMAASLYYAVMAWQAAIYQNDPVADKVETLTAD
ncbi:hypothetical protein EBB07_34015 [Paenibacillaceae bacterium]|nr:hypothetical protein EBB07_34015 [Paenibacillaceae bacterium]